MSALFWSFKIIIENNMLWFDKMPNDQQNEPFRSGLLLQLSDGQTFVYIFQIYPFLIGAHKFLLWHHLCGFTQFTFWIFYGSPFSN